MARGGQGAVHGWHSGESRRIQSGRKRPAGTLLRRVGSGGELYDLLFSLASEPKEESESAAGSQDLSDWKISMQERMKYLPPEAASLDTLVVYVPSIDEAGKVDTSIDPEKDGSGRWVSYFFG